jgi:hypothetical protein
MFKVEKESINIWYRVFYYKRDQNGPAAWNWSSVKPDFIAAYCRSGYALSTVPHRYFLPHMGCCLILVEPFCENVLHDIWGLSFETLCSRS